MSQYKKCKHLPPSQNDPSSELSPQSLSVSHRYDSGTQYPLEQEKKCAGQAMRKSKQNGEIKTAVLDVDLRWIHFDNISVVFICGDCCA